MRVSPEYRALNRDVLCDGAGYPVYQSIIYVLCVVFVVRVLNIVLARITRVSRRIMVSQ